MMPRAVADVGLESSVGFEIVWLIFSSKMCLPAVAVQPTETSMPDSADYQPDGRF
jgi:hypothetical protein